MTPAERQEIDAVWGHVRAYTRVQDVLHTGFVCRDGKIYRF